MKHYPANNPTPNRIQICNHFVCRININVNKNEILVCIKDSDRNVCWRTRYSNVVNKTHLLNYIFNVDNKQRL